jgi:hypothetical protein
MGGSLALVPGHDAALPTAFELVLPAAAAGGADVRAG